MGQRRITDHTLDSPKTHLCLNITGATARSPTTSQLLSILASNPGLQALALINSVIPQDDGGGSTFQVPLRNLKKLCLTGRLRPILGVLDRLEFRSAGTRRRRCRGRGNVAARTPLTQLFPTCPRISGRTGNRKPLLPRMLPSLCRHYQRTPTSSGVKGVHGKSPPNHLDEPVLRLMRRLDWSHSPGTRASLLHDHPC